MYEQYYGLTEKPFSILPDPSYIYWGPTHSMAFAMLEYGVINRAGFVAITGGIGCGKTTLIRHLLKQIQEDVTVGLISNTQDNVDELLQWVLLAFDQPYEGKSKVALFDQFQKFLADEYAKGRRTILIVDEAQNLGVKTLEELRMLSNINADKHQLLQLILVGQLQLKELLQRPELVQFSQRVSADFNLQPLGPEDVVNYIIHRLEVAGRTAPLFTVEAYAAIYQATKGIPRLINILCDTLLVYGYAGEMGTIGADVVEEVVRDKATHGVFSLVEQTSATKVAPDNPQQGHLSEVADDEEVKPGLVVNEDETKPALIVNDPELAKMLLDRIKAK